MAAALLAITGRKADTALHLLRAAQEQDANHRLRTPGVYAVIGQAYLRLRRHSEAGRAFTTALELDGDCVEAHAGLAAVRLAEGDPATAAESARRAIALQSDAATNHYRLAKALAACGDDAQARDALLTALKLAPNSPTVLRKLSSICHRLGDDRAGREYDLAAHLALAQRRLMPQPLPHA